MSDDIVKPLPCVDSDLENLCRNESLLRVMDDNFLLFSSFRISLGQHKYVFKSFFDRAANTSVDAEPAHVIAVEPRVDLRSFQQCLEEADKIVSFKPLKHASSIDTMVEEFVDASGNSIPHFIIYFQPAVTLSQRTEDVERVKALLREKN
jgi:hypothetical protein